MFFFFFVFFLFVWVFCVGVLWWGGGGGGRCVASVSNCGLGFYPDLYFLWDHSPSYSLPPRIGLPFSSRTFPPSLALLPPFSNLFCPVSVFILPPPCPITFPLRSSSHIHPPFPFHLLSVSAPLPPPSLHLSTYLPTSLPPLPSGWYKHQSARRKSGFQSSRQVRLQTWNTLAEHGHLLVPAHLPDYTHLPQWITVFFYPLWPSYLIPTMLFLFLSKLLSLSPPLPKTPSLRSPLVSGLSMICHLSIILRSSSTPVKKKKKKESKICGSMHAHRQTHFKTSMQRLHT